MRRRLLVSLLAGFCLAAAALPAAGSAALWRNVTGNTNTNLTAVQMVRAGTKGPLHVVWVGPESNLDSRDALYERDVLPGGTLGPRRKLVGVTGGLTNPSIARNPVDGRVWVFGAGAGVFNGRLFALSSGDGFATATPPTPISTSEYAYAPTDSSAAFSSTGEAFQTFGVHAKRGLGVDPGEDDLSTAPGIDSGFMFRCCAYWSHVAVDAKNGHPLVGWYSNIDPDRAGLEVVSLATGTTRYVPGSATKDRADSHNGDMPTPITGRIGAGGVFVGYCGGYPTCTRALVWRYGSAAPTQVGTGNGIDYVRVAAAPGGKLWAFWYRNGIVYATRSNAAVNSWGARVRVLVPGGDNATVFRIAGDGAAGFLDVFTTQDHKGAHAVWTTRVLPGLSVSGAVKGMAGNTVTFVVTDAGVPVPGAKVTLRGVSDTTDSKGVARLVVTGKPGSAAVRASAPGFTAGAKRFRVRAG